MSGRFRVEANAEEEGSGIERMSCGNNVGDGVSGRYSAQYRPIGTNKKVTVDVSSDLIQDDETEVRRIMAKQ